MLTTIGWLHVNEVESTIAALERDPVTSNYGVWRIGNTHPEWGKIQLLLEGPTLSPENKTYLRRYGFLFNHNEAKSCTNCEPITFTQNLPELSGIGTTLENLIRQVTKVEINCSACKEEILRLNSMSVEEVFANVDSITESIVNRAAALGVLWYSKIFGFNVAGKLVISRLIRKACRLQRLKTDQKRLTWKYAITTVPSRINTTFRRTLESLANTGFETPILSIDDCSVEEAATLYKEFNLPYSCRGSRIKTAGHWVLTLWELYIREPHFDRYAIFQDDFVCVKNLKRYLELQRYPDKGYLNLYTFPENQALATPGTFGWYQSNQLGKGAVALVFSNEAVRTLLASNSLVNRFLGPRANRAIDGGIVTSFTEAGWKEYVHNPSLVQHIGEVSSMGNSRHPDAITFPGEDYDILKLI